MKVGDRVAWTGRFNFGRDVRRVTGTVVKIGLGIPSYRQEGEVGSPSYQLIETGRMPACEVVMDGHEPKVHEEPIVVAVDALEIIE